MASNRRRRCRLRRWRLARPVAVRPVAVPFFDAGGFFPVRRRDALRCFDERDFAERGVRALWLALWLIALLNSRCCVTTLSSADLWFATG
jgi:hypothetical protein